MIVLLLFAYVAGAATAITPCVLPVLPALLSASASGGRRRPLGVVTGLALAFTITIVGLASVVDGVGVGDGTLRTLAIWFLVLFGLALLVPAVAQRLDSRLAFMSRLGPRRAGSGFWSGLPVGGALGFVYAPCAGPILAAVISVSASRGTSSELVAVAIAYALGSATVLLALALGGRRVVAGVRRAGRGPALQRTVGAVMVITAVLMLANLDIRFQRAIADDLPSWLTNPTRALEATSAVKSGLADLGGEPRFDSSRPPRKAGTVRVASAADAALSGVQTPALPRLGAAPEFTKTQRWFNGKPRTMASLRGRVTLIDFWTYTCINCLRTLPYLRAWDERYRARGLTIVGVHTPEFRFERRAANVHGAIRHERLRYPVVQDNEFGTWNAFTNRYWPAKYLIDAVGQVRYTHFGEGKYEQTEAAIRALLAEAGARRLGPAANPGAQDAPGGHVLTPETYLGSARAAGFTPAGPREGTHDYQAAAPEELPRNVFTLGGRWTIGRESARAVRSATLAGRVVARNVFLVLSSAGERPRKVRVSLDGKPISRAAAGQDVSGRALTVRRQRLYRLVRLPALAEHVLTLRLDPGVSAYAFTFG